MPATLFLQNVIAIVWDFDKTLIPGYMQEPLFRRYGVDAAEFWQEVRALPDFYKKNGLELVSPDSLYLNHILAYVRHGSFAGLSNAVLRELGQELTFYPRNSGHFPEPSRSSRRKSGRRAARHSA